VTQAAQSGRPTRGRHPRSGAGRQHRLRLAASASVRWLTRWFSTRTLTPFAVYSLLAGAGSFIVLAARGALRGGDRPRSAAAADRAGAF
jgi:hypothetical protein